MDCITKKLFALTHFYLPFYPIKVILINFISWNSNYTTWESVEQAKKAGKHLLEKRLCGCVNIYPEMQPMFWWPPRENKLDGSKEVVMIAKTLKRKYEELEKEIYKIHTYDTPCINQN